MFPREGRTLASRRVVAPYTDYFAFACVSFDLDAPTGAPIYTEDLVKCLPGVRSCGGATRVVSLVTHVDIQNIVWADDETDCYAVQCKHAKDNRIVVKRSGPIKIVSARR
jgi:hypothetical protein